MSFFTNQVLSLESNAELIKFSKFKRPVILTVSSKSMIYFYKEDQPSYNSYITLPDICSSISWSFASSMLAIGLKNGNILFYDYNTNTLSPPNITSQIPVEINFLYYNKNGTILLASDKTGSVSFFKSELFIKNKQFKAPITHALSIDFRLEKNGVLKKTVPLLFFGDKLGNIYYCQEKNLETLDLCQVNGSIKALMYYNQTQSIIIITSSLLFLQFEISVTKKISPSKKVKLSLNCPSDKLKIEWMNPNMFCICSNDIFLRIWNIEYDSTYNLFYNQIPDITGNIINCKYDEMFKNMIIGTDTGYLFAYSNINNSGTEEDWKLHNSYLKLESKILEIDIHISGFICVKTESSLHVISISKLQNYLIEDRLLVQRNIKEIEYSKYPFESKSKIELKNNLKYFDYYNNKLICWNGVFVDIYDILKLDNIKIINSFELFSKYIFFSKLGIIAVGRYSIKVYSIEGNAINEIKFRREEGEIIQYSKVKKYLLLNTRKGYIKIISLDKPELSIDTQINSITEIIKDAKIVKSIHISNNGINILFIIKDKSNNNCIYVYNIEKKSCVKCKIKDINVKKVVWDNYDNKNFTIMCVNQEKTMIINYFITDMYNIIVNESFEVPDKYE